MDRETKKDGMDRIQDKICPSEDLHINNFTQRPSIISSDRFPFQPCFLRPG